MLQNLLSFRHDADCFPYSLGVGFLVMVIPLYQAELAHPSIRGRITALQQFMLGVGSLVASWISWATYVHIHHNSAQWRVPLGLQIIPAVFLGLLIFMFPESPRYAHLASRSLLLWPAASDTTKHVN